MILGFAHLALATGDTIRTAEGLLAKGWTERARHEDVRSAPEKHGMLARPATRHDLMILSGPVPIEVLAHDTGAEPGPVRLAVGTDRVEMTARDARLEGAFFREGLGFARGEAGSLVLDSRLPQWRIAVTLSRDETAPMDVPLDRAGFSALAFLSTDPEGDGGRLILAGGRDATPPFEILLGNRRMRILMVRSPEGTIIELIKIGTNR